MSYCCEVFRMESGEVKQRQRALNFRVQETEKRYRSLVEKTGDVIYQVNLTTGEYEYVSPNIEEMTGYSSQEFIRFKVQGALERVVHPVDAPRLLETLEQVNRKRLEGEEAPFSFEYRVIRNDGSIIWVSDRNLPLFDGDREVRAIGSLRDITQTRASEERSRQLAALNAIATAVHRSLELEEVYRLALDAVVRVVNLEVVGIYLVDEDTKEAVLQAQRGFSENYVRRAGRIAYPRAVTWKVIQSGEVYMTENVQDDPHIGPAGKAEGLAFLLSVPIRSKEKAIGVIHFSNRRSGIPGPQEIDFLTAVGHQIGVAVNNARLYEEARERAQRIAVTSEINRIVTSSLNIQEVYRAFARELHKLVDFDALSILLIEGDEVRVVVIEPAGEKRPDLWPLSKKTLWEWMGGFPIPLIFHDLSEEDERLSQLWVLFGPGRGSGMMLPLVVKGQFLGSLNLASQRRGHYSQKEMTLLLPIAEQLAVAVENARLYDELRVAGEQLRTLSARLIQAQEVERARLSRELHDEVGQALTAIKLDLQMLGEVLPPGHASLPGRLNESVALVDQTLERVRLLAVELRPPALDELGLVAALRTLVKSFAYRSGISARVEVQGQEGRLSREGETALYRAVQEGLTNVSRHAQASQVTVRLEWREDQIRTEIQDDGVGFRVEDALRPHSPGGGVGLLGMRERLELLGGNLQVISRLGGGTRLELELPLKNKRG